jgi:integrase
MFGWEWERDIDFRTNQVRAWRRKGRGELFEYWVPMVDDLERLLRAQADDQLARWGKVSRYVWPNAANSNHDDGREFVRTVFKPALFKAGILRLIETRQTTQVRAGFVCGRNKDGTPKRVPGLRTVEKLHRRVEGSFRWKDLRHTFASWMRKRGVHLDAIGSLLGHRPGSPCTYVYAHLTSDLKEQAVNRLAGLLTVQ